jgi:mersacidin/lichenicidin family type 2 lantibiotic
MPVADVIRAWKDPDYLASLGDEASHLPPNPAGLIVGPPQEQGLAANYSLTCTKIECTNVINCTRIVCE